MGNKAKVQYTELSTATISPTRLAVISSCSKGGYTIAQKLQVEENGKTTGVFLQGALHIDNEDALLELRDALNLALLRTTKEN